MKNIAVFYHKADNDGVMSGVIAEHYLTPRFDFVHMIPIDYGENFEKALPCEPSFYQEFYILDVSDEAFMLKHGDKIIYIDHHDNAVKNMPKVKDRHCVIGVAACRLTFDYLAGGPDYVFHGKSYFENRENPLEPLCVAILGEYDIWDKKSSAGEMLNFGQEPNFNSVKYLFNRTKRILCSDSRSKSYDLSEIKANKNISENYRDWGYLNYLINKGEGALNYIKESVSRIKPIKFDLDDLVGVYINSNIDPSLIGLSYTLKDDEDFLMVWHLNNEKYVKASFRSDKVDVGAIARIYGGNGHKAASGCRMSLGKLIDLIKPRM
jgi:oligoribonuclease NrnB/cAMP/cGMP phosphodiesterase (DHH superfamily)